MKGSRRRLAAGLVRFANRFGRGVRRSELQRLLGRSGSKRAFRLERQASTSIVAPMTIGSRAAADRASDPVRASEALEPFVVEPPRRRCRIMPPLDLWPMTEGSASPSDTERPGGAVLGRPYRPTPSVQEGWLVVCQSPLSPAGQREPRARWSHCDGTLPGHNCQALLLHLLSERRVRMQGRARSGAPGRRARAIRTGSAARRGRGGARGPSGAAGALRTPWTRARRLISR